MLPWTILYRQILTQFQFLNEDDLDLEKFRSLGNAAFWKIYLFSHIFENGGLELLKIREKLFITPTDTKTAFG